MMFGKKNNSTNPQVLKTRESYPVRLDQAGYCPYYIYFVWVTRYIIHKNYTGCYYLSEADVSRLRNTVYFRLSTTLFCKSLIEIVLVGKMIGCSSPMLLYVSS